MKIYIKNKQMENHLAKLGVLLTQTLVPGLFIDPGC